MCYLPAEGDGIQWRHISTFPNLQEQQRTLVPRRNSDYLLLKNMTLIKQTETNTFLFFLPCSASARWDRARTAVME